MRAATRAEEKADAPGRLPRGRIPSAPLCFLVILAVKTALATLGFERARHLTLWLSAGRGAASGPYMTAAVAIADQVALSAAFFPGRALCLEQSLTLLFLLRRRGLQATFRLGVQPYPFAAHAWIEHDGVAILEDAEFLKPYLPLTATRGGER